MAGVDAAEAAAIECWYPLTDKEVKRLGYLGTDGVCGNSPFPLASVGLSVKTNNRRIMLEAISPRAIRVPSRETQNNIPEK
jgi:hypothetical protein